MENALYLFQMHLVKCNYRSLRVVIRDQGHPACMNCVLELVSYRK